MFGGFSPLTLPFGIAAGIPRDNAASLASRARYGAAQRGAYKGFMNGQPAPGQELGAGLPSTSNMMKNGLGWLQQHADPNPGLYGQPSAPPSPQGGPAAAGGPGAMTPSPSPSLGQPGSPPAFDPSSAPPLSGSGFGLAQGSGAPGMFGAPSSGMMGGPSPSGAPGAGVPFPPSKPAGLGAPSGAGMPMPLSGAPDSQSQYGQASPADMGGAGLTGPGSMPMYNSAGGMMGGPQQGGAQAAGMMGGPQQGGPQQGNPFGAPSAGSASPFGFMTGAPGNGQFNLSNFLQGGPAAQAALGAAPDKPFWNIARVMNGAFGGGAPSASSSSAIY